MGGRRVEPSGPPRSFGQHFLRSPLLAASLVEAAGVRPSDVVVEIGAGAGALTEPLAARAKIVFAVELDPKLAGKLRSRVAGLSNVQVAHDDALHHEWPRERFRAFGNVPFHVTTALLRSLLRSPALERADLIVQWEVAVKRSLPVPRNLLNLSWGPWWTFSTGIHLDRSCFRPPPSVDAGVLTVVRRDPPLLPLNVRDGFARFVGRAYARPQLPIRRSLRSVLTERQVQRLAFDLSFDRHARAIDLDLLQWIELFRFAAGGPRAGGPRPGRSQPRG